MSQAHSIVRRIPAVSYKLVTAPSGGYLDAVRRVFDDADDALVCVAFAQARGVHLLKEELTTVARRGRARVVVTTTLGTSSEAALSTLTQCRAELKILNPGGATYHPKVYLGRKGTAVRAVIGSANLTSGLVANVEAGAALEGTMREHAIADLWKWAETVWDDPRTKQWQAPAGPAFDEQIEPDLLRLLADAARTDPTVYTLGRAAKPNFVRDVTAGGLWVETQRSRKLQAGDGRAASQHIPARMLNLAWDTLRARGRLTNRELLDELRVHRSSFVCAILARLPGVKREEGEGIVLTYALEPKPPHVAHDAETP